jgi:RNA polymerase sigma-70 factor (ECF subfamily)
LSTALAQAPSADATRQLFERHSSRIFGFCLSRLGSREEAEDAVQTTFLNVQRGLGRGVVPEYELAWLFKIAQNVCHNRHQSARRRGRVEAAHDLDALQDVIASPDRSPAVSLGDLTHALGAIPTRQRKALLLREFQGYSYEEIASELGISVAAVETLLFRARRAVARQLEQSGTTSLKQRGGAAASVVELFRWLFGGAAAPLKLAAVTAAVATTAVLSVAADHKLKPGPVVPVIVKHSTVVPASTVRPRHVARSTARPATVRAVAEQSPRPTLAVPTAPAVQAASSGPGAQPALISPVVEPAIATVVPTVSVPELTTPEVTLPAVTVPGITVPAITVPAITVPALTVPALTVPALTVPAVVLPNVQLPTTLDLPTLP